jgi:hypothetical protein
MSADAIVMAAEALDGLSFGATREKYVVALLPYDQPTQGRAMASSMSSCGLTCEAILRAAGVDGRMLWRGKDQDWLRVPYGSRIATAVSCQLMLGYARQLWHEVGAYRAGDPLPEPGDMLMVGGPAGWGGVQHVLTVLGRDGLKMATVEGGQTDPKNGFRSTGIRRVERVLRGVTGALWCGGPAVQGRRVQGWLRAGELSCLPGS